MSLKKELYRDTEKGKIAGVCAGVAEYFGWELWLVRIIVISGMLLSGSFFLVAYVAAWFILDKKSTAADRTTGTHWTGSHSANLQAEEHSVEVKAKVWQAGEPPKQAFFDINKRFILMEKRLRKMETYVTSSEYQLNREINRL